MRNLETLSGLGVGLGTLFFAASLTPTLIPRTPLTQGVLAGTCFVLGYGQGVFVIWLWRYLELPGMQPRMRFMANALIAALCLAVALVFLWWSAEWQNSIRSAMNMEPVTGARPFEVTAIALATFLVLLALGRLCRLAIHSLAGFTGRYVPRRLANVLGVGLALLFLWLIADNLLVSAVFRGLDASFRELDALIEPNRPQPTDGGKPGSPASLVKWEELGRAGREFIAHGPTAAEIRAVTGRPAIEPIRVYVGLPAADTPGARARLALEELKRTGGFDRSILIVVTPTGTGWIDPAAMDSVEYLRAGDVASVAVQYSYLSSPLSLLAEPEYGAETARALFLEIYGYWTSLPEERRPKIFLHGLSLGSLNSERSAGFIDMLGDPIAGALWSGPPFESDVWRRIADARNPDSPEWLPEFRDGSVVRFMNQNGPAVPTAAPWGPMRIVYLQYASDPVVFFDYRDLYRRPAWMEAPVGPDVSRELRWYPVVTMLQLALDMAVATTTPIGYGHVYAPQHYVDAWVAVADARDWSPEALEVLKQRLAADATSVEDNSYDDRGG